jgi:ribosomal protein S27AE
MTTTKSTENRGQADANRLYWHSESTVDEIVNDLGIGRSALYAAVHPISAGSTCPNCGNRMVFTNRSNRSAGRAVCGACGTQALSSDRESNERREAGTSRETPLDGVSDGWRPDAEERSFAPEHGLWYRWREDLSTVEPQRAAMVGGAAVLGVVVGAAAIRAVREML